MEAIVVYRNGESDQFVGASGSFGDVAEDLRTERPDIVCIWCVMDELGEKWDVDMDPYWAAEDFDLEEYRQEWRCQYALVETWRDGTMDGRPETVTPIPDRKSAVRAAEAAWERLSRQERRKYRVLAIDGWDGADWGTGDVIWDSEGCE